MEYFLLVGLIALLHWIGRVIDVGTGGAKIFAIALLIVISFPIYINYSRFSQESAIIDALCLSAFVISGFMYGFDVKVSLLILSAGIIAFILINFFQLFGASPGLLNYYYI